MIVQTNDDLNKMLEWASKQERIFYDIETSGLNSRSDVVIGIGASSAFSGYYLPLYSYNPNTGNLDYIEGSKESAVKLLSILSTKKICTFNGAFDLPFTKQFFGIDLLPALYCDVLLLKHTVDEEFPFKLKEIAVQVFGYGAASEQRDLQAELKAVGASKSEIYKATVATIGKYCIQDCLLTAKLFNFYSFKLKEQGLEQFFYQDEVMPLYKHVTIPMEQTGIKLNLPLMQKTLEEINTDIINLEHNIQKQIKPHLDVFYDWFLNKDYPVTLSGNFLQAYAKLHNLQFPLTASGKLSITIKTINALPDSTEKQVLLKQIPLPVEDARKVQLQMAFTDHGDSYLFNLQSKHHLKKLFFDTLKLTPLSTTDLGSPQVDDEFIHSISGEFAWANDLHVYNKLQKIKATYIERFLEKQQDGIFYPSFFQHRTVSGRLAGDFQQLPRPIEDNSEHVLVTKYTNLIRSFFIAREGTVFVDADYNSAEPRVFAYVSGDQGLKDIFQKNLDFYSHIAIMTEKLQGVSALKSAENYLGKVLKSKRQDAKAYALGTPYGLTGYKLAFQLDCTPDEGDKLIQNYLNAFPKLKEWMQNTQKLVLKTGQVKTMGGRIRHLNRATQIYNKHGDEILDTLYLYKQYSDSPSIYEEMKKLRKELKNYINNANNVQIQATVASIINRASIKIALKFKELNLQANIIAQIHDQLVVEASEECKEIVAQIVQQEMEGSAKQFILDVPIPAEPNFGYNLLESKGA